MRNLKRLVIALLAVLAISAPASAQFRLGLKAGVNISSMSFDKDVLNSDNRTGFTGGLTCEFTVPIIGLGFDLSALYVHRSTDLSAPQAKDASVAVKGDYIQIPLNLKYKLGLPGVGRLVTPYITTGPSVSFLCSKKAAIAAMEQKKFDAAWNVGAGVQLLSHLQIGANYGFGMTKAFTQNGADLGKTNGWTITAAYFF